MKKLLSKINNNSLLTGIISSLIIVYFFEPIMALLGKWLINIYKASSTALYDRIFKEIALGKPDYGFIIYQSIFFSFLIFITYEVFLSDLLLRKNNRTETKNIEEPEFEQEQKLAKLDNRISILKVILIFCMVLILGQLVISDIKLKNIQAFEQQIRIISPYIDVKAKEKIISDFSQMTGSKDFESINKTIIDIAIKNGIVLPKIRNHLF